MFQEIFPKGSDFTQITDEELEHVLPHQPPPRQCLDWKITHERFTEELLHLG
ncbi:hypothetical protein [Paenibacillus maysiensis]|uniref:hypothetical protein n=1 Tax=Paenibacillus maysiensis TaxID=1155954 RepID=UPI0004AFA67B|nr:hypothetical protein [Paenibacillus maysiensis]